MLLNSDSAIKIAHDIIHDVNELVSKWPDLLKDMSAIPDGYVDLEFSSGKLARIPCAWKTASVTAGATRPSIVLKNNNNTATWKYLNHAVSVDMPLIVKDIVTSSISNGPVPVELVDAFIDAAIGTELHLSECSIQKLSVTGDAVMVSPKLKDLIAPNGNAVLDAATVHSAKITELLGTGEYIVPMLKMNAWSPYGDTPKTDAPFTGHIPFMPFDSAATPINGFGLELENNPFYPDWIYACATVGPWKPSVAWVPSLERPGGVCWRDSDGIYWQPATITTPYSNYGAVCVAYPPRCKLQDSSVEVLPPLKKEADGLVVTVKILGDYAIPICITDRYELSGLQSWSWVGGKTVLVRGPQILQFTVRRVFEVTDDRITAMEYQLLPLGDMDVQNA